MGKLANELDAMGPQFDKVLAEVRASKELDADDRAALDRHKARLQELDDENPDAPAPQPETPVEPAPEPSPEPTEPA